MLTQCPHCLTLFRIGPEQLKVAAGKVRCSRCNQVFNALQRLEEHPAPFLQSERTDGEDFWQDDDGGLSDTDSGSSAWQAGSTADDDGQFTRADAYPEDEEPGTDDMDASELALDTGSDFILEQDDGLETEPEYFATDTESQMSALLDQDSASTLLAEEEADEAGAEIVDFVRSEDATSDEDETPPGYDFGDSILKDEALDLEEGKPDYDSVPSFRASVDEPPQSQLPVADESVFTFEAVTEPVKRKPGSRLWLLGSFILLLLLGGQIAWQFRESLIRYDAGRQTLAVLCKVAGCRVPIRRATDKIIIQGRNLSTHPDQPDVLFMQLSMVNSAAFEQPFPKVQLSLFNDKGKLIARRTFAPDEYLPQSEQGRTMMPVAQPILVEMQLVDPGKEVTGFTFDFL